MRPTWDEYFMNFASTAAYRATCKRKSVGSAIVVDQQVVATGYNGSIRGAPHCIDVGCDMEDGHCVRTIHAEMNALAQAAQRGAAVRGATIYSTASPCWACWRVLVNAGIRAFVYAEEYRAGDKDQMKRITKHAVLAGLDVRQLEV